MARSVRPLVSLFVASLVPLLAACPKKEPPPVVDAGAPAPTPADTSSADFQPLTSDDAGADDAGIDAGTKPKWNGTPTNTNVARLKQCCSKLGEQAKQLGNSPEGGMLMTAVAQCNASAAAIAPGQNAPEFGAIRTLLQGKNVPAVCSGF